MDEATSYSGLDVVGDVFIKQSCASTYNLQMMQSANISAKFRWLIMIMRAVPYAIQGTVFESLSVMVVDILVSPVLRGGPCRVVLYIRVVNHLRKHY